MPAAVCWPARLVAAAAALSALSCSAAPGCSDAATVAGVIQQLHSNATANLPIVLPDKRAAAAALAAAGQVSVALSATRTTRKVDNTRRSTCAATIVLTPSAQALQRFQADRYTGQGLFAAGMAVAAPRVQGPIVYTVQPADDGRGVWLEIPQGQHAAYVLTLLIAANSPP